MSDDEREQLQEWGWRYATPAVITFALLAAFQVLVDSLLT